VLGSLDNRFVVLEKRELWKTVADGSLQGVTQKFSRARQGQAIIEVMQELKGELPFYRGDWREGEIEVIGVQRIISLLYWCIVEYEVLFPPRNGDRPAKGTYWSLRWNSGLDAGAGAIPVTTDGHIVLLRSFRHSARSWCIELPIGARRPDETLKECAIREASEEVGAELTHSSEVIPLGTIDPDTGVMMQHLPIWLVTNVSLGKSNRDVSESHLDRCVVTFTEFWQMVDNGEITCARTISAVVKAERALRRMAA
jgi:ADP-ribose pyrophosphatase